MVRFLGAIAALVLVCALDTGCRVRRERPAPKPSASVAVAPAPSVRPSAVPAPPRPKPEEPVKDASVDAEPESLDAPEGALVLVLGAVRASPATLEGVRVAARFATRGLLSGGEARVAAVAGMVALEDDPDFPAGVGSALRDDGSSIECEAALMLDDGSFGAVAALRRTRNPIRVADAMLSTSDRVRVGRGAQKLAQELGFEDTSLLTPGAVERYRAARRAAPSPAADAGASPPPKEVDAGIDVEAESPAQAEPDRTPPSDPVTVAVLVRAADGHFAASASSGGLPSSGIGVMGEVPIEGAALYVGPAGAVAVSGSPEQVARLLLAREGYRQLERYGVPSYAAKWMLKQIEGPVAAAVIGRHGSSVQDNYPSVWAVNGPNGERLPELDDEERKAPVPAVAPRVAAEPAAPRAVPRAPASVAPTAPRVPASVAPTAAPAPALRPASSVSPVAPAPVVPAREGAQP